VWVTLTLIAGIALARYTIAAVSRIRQESRGSGRSPD
jgi:hypothetical protein